MTVVEGSVVAALGHIREHRHGSQHEPHPEVASQGLSARAAAVALRVAGLVEVNCSPESSLGAVSFLRSWAGQALESAPPVMSAPAPLDLLCARYDYGQLDLDLLLLAGLPEEHEGLAGTFRALHPSGQPRPTLGLAALLAGTSAGSRSQVRRLCAPGGVIGDGLVRLGGDGPLFERSIDVAPEIWNALHGHDTWPPGIQRVQVGSPPAGLDGWLLLAPVQQAVAALASPVPRTIVAASEDAEVALSRCAAMAFAAGAELVAGRISADDAAGAQLIAAHASLRGAFPVICVTSASYEGGLSQAAIDLSSVPGPVLVCARPGSVQPDNQRPLLAVPMGPIADGDHRRAWAQNVPHLRSSAATLAARHPLDPALTAVVATDLRSRYQLGGETGLPDVSAAIRSRAGVSLPTGVSLTTPNVTWDHLVLPDEPTAQLRDAVARLDHQRLVLEDWGYAGQARAGRGVRLLFTGPPGTGKSLGAAAVAHAAGTDLLVVDVARLVSKWIGETEKNLAGAFDVAERTRALLLLDEADVLFGTRTQISDANDRYANLETAYLLQRMDSFDGLIVLTTNLRQNIDAAFMRRVDFLVEFGMPDEANRAKLWRLHLPDRAALARDVDLGCFARMYPVPGAWIRNAAIAAAFLAAPAGGPITRDHLARAMRREYAKGSRPYPGDPPLGASPDSGRRGHERL